MEESLVREIADFQAAYTMSVMHQGALEGVTWPYFGKFRTDPEYVQFKGAAKGRLKYKNIQFPNSPKL